MNLSRKTCFVVKTFTIRYLQFLAASSQLKLESLNLDPT